MASNFFAALQMFSIPAAFLADSYIKRFYTVLIFGPVEIVVQLATQTFSPKLYTSFFLLTLKVEVLISTYILCMVNTFFQPKL
jgi:hypothetical protein